MRICIQLLTYLSTYLVGPPRDNPEPDPLAVLHLNNQLWMYVIILTKLTIICFQKGSEESRVKNIKCYVDQKLWATEKSTKLEQRKWVQIGDGPDEWRWGHWGLVCRVASARCMCVWLITTTLLLPNTTTTTDDLMLFPAHPKNGNNKSQPITLTKLAHFIIYHPTTSTL